MTIRTFRDVSGTDLLILWEDGHRSLYPYRLLRYLCPCAGCVNEHTGKRTIRPDQIPSDVRLSGHEQIGNYAIRFRWSDGHETGLYAEDYLRMNCPCTACSPQAPSV